MKTYGLQNCAQTLSLIPEQYPQLRGTKESNIKTSFHLRNTFSSLCKISQFRGKQKMNQANLHDERSTFKCLQLFCTLSV